VVVAAVEVAEPARLVHRPEPLLLEVLQQAGLRAELQAGGRAEAAEAVVRALVHQPELLLLEVLQQAGDKEVVVALAVGVAAEGVVELLRPPFPRRLFHLSISL
jgi:hypothetical protein